MEVKIARPVRSRDRFLVFGSPLIEPEAIEEVVDCLRTGWLGTGPKVARFEEAFRRYVGAPHAVAVHSCTAALHLSLLSSGIGPGDEVITTPLTFCATVNAILHAGARPVLADVDPVTMNLDPAAVEAAITGRTAAILAVHFAGRPCSMDALTRIAERHGLLLLEDCAHAIEAEYRGRRTGTFGLFGCYSFYVTKNITTGEGGMVVTGSAEHAARIKRLSLHGLSHDAWRRFGDSGYRHYQVLEAGFKYNMTDLQAAIGLHQLPKIDLWWTRRKAIWERYNAAFADLPVIRPTDPEPETRHAFHLYTLLIDEERAGLSRDAFLQAMTAHHIGVGVHYVSIPEHPFYREHLGWRPEQWPVAMRIGRQTVSLPLSPKLTDEDVEDVIAAVHDIFSRLHTRWL
ncbi:MAG: DegT/DnrJ/EryC1/StrS family aminotransferase [Bacteroidetes bacterium]|nr:DegT/DnrJ/EryC1/StrS family aminotransferase [Rhodothermia bacterium]MCS7154697.1 DegT/DnrJ/EryC1/StrS family aminotransferase [Bacteroidota bacterium]MCX7907146.1 DegT/DnrJ/EryC1/StrS family aminotransferase [Bacteroidota bacterium]MDW8137490.1 DegT/DnrJ/EryC1/StrS family aminotransferase [Bacteroidota bacterium]MDW8285556.1 DegT/DnrJ/EryC1/StrS family aminotransferase [Bacteroidota bacterium]